MVCPPRVQERGRIMEILVDHKKIEFEPSKVRNLEEVILKLMADKIQGNNVITAVRLNGEFYSEKIPHDASKVPIRDIQTLEIETMSTEEVAWHFLIQSGKQLDRLMENAKQVSELFRVADETEANEQYAIFLESLRLFIQMLNEVQAILNLDLAAIPYQNGTIETKVHTLLGLADQMHKVQEEEDWVMLADLLEYELAPLLEEWKSILSLLQNKKEN